MVTTRWHQITARAQHLTHRAVAASYTTARSRPSRSPSAWLRGGQGARRARGL